MEKTLNALGINMEANVDQIIYTFTKNLITNNPTFKNQDDWRTQMQEKLLQANANIQ